MYFRLGGGTLRGIAKPGEIVWSRIFIENAKLKMDLGRATVVELPRTETARRWNATTPEWPIMHAVLHGVSRDQMMARHKANHIQVVYARSPMPIQPRKLTSPSIQKRRWLPSLVSRHVCAAPRRTKNPSDDACPRAIFNYLSETQRPP